MSEKAKRMAEKYGPWPYHLIMERKGVEVERKTVQAYGKCDAEGHWGAFAHDLFDEEIAFRAERLNVPRP